LYYNLISDKHDLPFRAEITCCIVLIIITIVFIVLTACEIANTKNRTLAAAWTNISAGAAPAVYAGIAYFIRDWKYIQLTISLIPAAYFFMYYFLPETPR